MNHFVASAYNNSAFSNRAGRVIRKLAFAISITPRDSACREIYCEHFIVEGTVKRLASGQGGGCSGGRARCYVKHFFAVGNANSPKRFVTASDVRHASRNACGAMNRSAGSKLPDQ